MTWVFLTVAVLFEVAATLALKAATDGRKAWYALVVVGYAVAFTSLTLVLNMGMGIGVAYGVWAAAGVSITAVASRYLFKEPFTKVMALGIAMVAAGVLLVELGAAH
jgi:small multidrug resistance pump